MANAIIYIIYIIYILYYLIILILILRSIYKYHGNCYPFAIKNVKH
jgi:hypothetical protein